MSMVKPKVLLAFWCLVLVLYFGGMVSVNISILNSYVASIPQSFIELWELPGWGPYIILSFGLSIATIAIVVLNFVEPGIGRIILSGLVLMSIALDLHKSFLGIDLNNVLKSIITLAIPPLMIHTYLIYLLMCKLDGIKTGAGRSHIPLG